MKQVICVLFTMSWAAVAAPPTDSWRADNEKAVQMARDVKVSQAYLPPNVAAYINQVVAPRIETLETELEFERRRVRALEIRLKAVQEELNTKKEK